VRFSPPSINKNNKSDREKNREYLANESSDFNRIKKFGINAKNYTRKELISIFWTRVGIPELDKKIKQPKKIEEYNQEKDRRNTTSIEMIM
jgi:hypothetical protein